MNAKESRWILWIGAGILGAILAAFLAPGILEKRATPERLRSREGSDGDGRRSGPGEPRSLRRESKGIKVTFNPVEEEPPKEEDRSPARNRIDRYPAAPEDADSLN